jgi:two-component system, chemotaxis family, chemotaxis protein CheY
MANPKIRFLVVDESSTLRRIVRNYLMQVGYVNVEEAGDGMTALSKLKLAPFDFVVSGWRMPDMDGLTLLRRIRSDPTLAKLAVLMVMAEANKENLTAASQAGASGVAIKPFTPETFNGTVNSILAKLGMS